jgi:hypothetical protein
MNIPENAIRIDRIEEIQMRNRDDFVPYMQQTGNSLYYRLIGTLNGVEVWVVPKAEATHTALLV